MYGYKDNCARLAMATTLRFGIAESQGESAFRPIRKRKTTRAGETPALRKPRSTA